MTSKIMKMCEQILKKKKTLQYNSNSLNCKKQSRTSPDIHFKKFSMTKQKTRPRTDYERIGKTISKKNQNQKQKNRKSMSKCR